MIRLALDEIAEYAMIEISKIQRQTMELPQMSNYKPFTKNSDHPTGQGNFFLVRPRGINPRFGEKYVPTVVQSIGGELYSSFNEIEPIMYGKTGPHADPYHSDCDLEWMELPE